MSTPTLRFSRLCGADHPQVGGKNSALGELIGNLTQAGVRVPDGFATTADSYRAFLQTDDLRGRLERELAGLDRTDLSALEAKSAALRELVLATPLPQDLHAAIAENCAQLKQAGAESFAVRSSATAEDLPDASFAGQQDTFLNIPAEAVPEYVRRVYASLFTARAITYRAHQGFEDTAVAMSVGVQRMVRSDLGASGVMFTIDTESGFPDVVLINAAWGLGENVVQGAVNPDEFYLSKRAVADGRPGILRRTLGAKQQKMIYAPDATAVRNVDTDEDERQRFCLNDKQLAELATLALKIERHYGRAMDIEWALDGRDGQLYIVQARPETVAGRTDPGRTQHFKLEERAEALVSGRAIGRRIAAGPVRRVQSLDQLGTVQKGDVLVTEMTDPDWEPAMQRAGAIVTDRGGRTCHAAIIARELGLPAVVGCGDASRQLTDAVDVTVCCAEGETGHIYPGRLKFSVEEQAPDLPPLPFELGLNIGNPEQAFSLARLPAAGVGLARLEFIINTLIGVHPQAVLGADDLPEALRRSVYERSAGYKTPRDFYVGKLVEGVSTLGAAFYPRPVIVRLSDFKSNEYANLMGGNQFEPHEDNPMLGFRGASRYLAAQFMECFKMECEALRHVRETMGFDNVQIMVPFVRTLEEARQVVALLEANGLRRGENKLRVLMMCEVPSNAILADEFLQFFDGFSIGSNDLTQFTLGLDRDSGTIAHLFDERDPAVKAMLKRAIEACRAQNKYVGICGQGPSDYPDLAEWLMQQGIQSVSLNPDSLLETWEFLGKKLGIVNS